MINVLFNKLRKTLYMKQSKYSNENPPLNDPKWHYTGSLSVNVAQTWIKYGFKPAKKYIFMITRKEIK